MPKEDWMENTVQKIFERANLWPTGKIKTVLDLACGISLKSQYVDADIRVGLDIYKPYLENIELENNVPHVLINADIMGIDELFLPKSFDLVLLLDIVEHLEKEQSLKLIKMAEEIAKVAVVIETPNGYIPQDMDILGYGGHTFQTHRCGWEPEELINMEYKIVIRDYQMSDTKRHSTMDVDTNIQLIDAIKLI